MIRCAFMCYMAHQYDTLCIRIRHDAFTRAIQLVGCRLFTAACCDTKTHDAAQHGTGDTKAPLNYKSLLQGALQNRRYSAKKTYNFKEPTQAVAVACTAMCAPHHKSLMYTPLWCGAHIACGVHHTTSAPRLTGYLVCVLCLCVVFVWGRVWAEKPRGFVQQPEMSVDVCTGEGSRLL